MRIVKVIGGAGDALAGDRVFCYFRRQVTSAEMRNDTLIGQDPRLFLPWTCLGAGLQAHVTLEFVYIGQHQRTT